MNDLRPISLCNVLYKLISKVVANRLKQVLSSIISDSQSAFLPGRLITDNILISFEVMHFLKGKTVGNTGCMALKLDLSKAYDRVEWEFLRVMLLKLGFSVHWIRIIMSCVSSVSLSVCSGHHEIGPIYPNRGLRQGDPLSPYLFLICIEGLSALISKAVQMGHFSGVKIARSAPTVSHIFFADDIYLFTKASVDMATSVGNLLQTFQRASGQQVNFSKSSIFF